MCSLCVFSSDILPPVVTCPSPISMSVDPGQPDASVTLSPSPSAVDTFDGSIDQSTIVCETSPGNPVTTGSRVRAGVTVATCRAADNAGNEGTCAFTITIEGMCIQSDANLRNLRVKFLL